MLKNNESNNGVSNHDSESDESENESSDNSESETEAGDPPNASIFHSNNSNVNNESTATKSVRFADENKSNKVQPTTTTRSGRVSKAATRLIEECGNMALTTAEQEYLKYLSELQMKEYEEADAEYALVGAGISSGIENTKELRVMKYPEAMAGEDREKWKEAVEQEHDKMARMKVWRPVKLKNFPKGSKILSSTWSMKKKANGVYCV